MEEAFIDRQYTADGLLVPRKERNAIIDDPKRALEQIESLIKNHKVMTIDGEEVMHRAQTFCVHSDHLLTASILRFLHDELPKLDIKIQRY